MPNTPKQDWDEYRERELAWILPALATYGYALDEHQPHVGGERYLMQAVTTTSGRKLILLGTRVSDGKRVVIKATSDSGGIQELVHERLCRDRLATITFAYGGFHVPEELLFEQDRSRVLSIQAYIPQDKAFLERPTPEQFALALSAFKTQEGAHAATYEHMRSIGKTFGIMRTEDYVDGFKRFRGEVLAGDIEHDVGYALQRAEEFLEANRDTIEQYGGFLTHTDFVPHNLRVVGSDIYLLDASSLRFGNKYEGLARFINFMVLYNPELADALVRYIADNRTPEELRSLRLMRVYRLGEIIAYYNRTLSKSDGDLHTLNQERVRFWAKVLDAVLQGTPLPTAVIESYKTKRDALRTPDEHLRQQGLH